MADVGAVDTSNLKQVREREAKAKLRDANRRRVLVQLLSTPEGRDWFWAKLSACNIFSQTFVAGDPHATSFNEGKRSIGLELLADQQRCAPQTYVDMQREAAENG